MTLKSIANDEPPAEEVLVDRPEVDTKITRVTGPFVVEATIPTPVDVDDDGIEDSGGRGRRRFVDRMLEVLRQNPVLQLGGNRTITLADVRPPAKSLSLSAEAVLEPDDTPVALVFGPENGAVSEKLVYEAAREAHMPELRAADRHRLRDRAEGARARREVRATWSASRRPTSRRRPTS